MLGKISTMLLQFSNTLVKDNTLDMLHYRQFTLDEFAKSFNDKLLILRSVA